MDWPLIVSIISCALGGGALTIIFASGAWKGKIEADIASIRTDNQETKNHLGNIDSTLQELASIKNREPTLFIESRKREIEAAKNEFKTEILVIRSSLQHEISVVTSKIENIITKMEEYKDYSRSHSSTSTDTATKLATIISGMTSQREEWAQLRDEVRSLIKNEASNDNEVKNIKEVLTKLELKLNEINTQTIKTEATVQHLSAPKGR